MKKKEFSQDRKTWFKAFKNVLRIGYRKPVFEYIGEKPEKGAIILSNHEGSGAPVTLEIYADFPIRMWGTHEMNMGLVELYKYQTEVYYHQKKHWNIHIARLFCLIASPLTNLFYKGLRLISTYRDRRFIKKTLRESIAAINENGENIVIYPEDSAGGYLKELTDFYSGFAVFAETLYRQGKDVKIFVAYFKRKERKYIFDKPVFYGELKRRCKDRLEMAKLLLDRCNALGNA